MTVYATFICKDEFKRQVVLPELFTTYRLPARVGNRLWMAKPENISCMSLEHREFYLESKKIIRNEYGVMARAIYREREK